MAFNDWIRVENPDPHTHFATKKEAYTFLSEASKKFFAQLGDQP